MYTELKNNAKVLALEPTPKNVPPGWGIDQVIYCEVIGGWIRRSDCAHCPDWQQFGECQC